MPTAIASKGGLRAAATAKRTKAAQRTPLPPKQEDLELAREAVATVPSQRSVFKTVAAVAANQCPKAGCLRMRNHAGKHGQPTQSEAALAMATPEPVNTKPDKAAHYAEELTKLGWVSGVTRLDGLCELVATRGNEALYLAWLKEAHVSGTSTHTIADRTVKVRNPAEAMRVAGQTPDEAMAKQAKVSGNTQFRKRPTGPTVRRVPFDLATATDTEIINAIEGHQISWHNPYRVDSEKATVGRARSIRIDDHRAGHRIVSFVDPEFGFRAFRLDLLENVGRKVDLDRIRQQILASLSQGKSKAKAA